MDNGEFHRVVHDTAERLWALGAVEATLAALYDALEEAGGGLDWRVAPEVPQQPTSKPSTVDDAA